MSYLGVIRMRGLEFQYKNESLDDLINYLEDYIIDNPRAVILGIINIDTLNVEMVGKSYAGRKKYVESELIDIANSL